MPNPKNIEPHKFKKGKSGNPKGRPKKLFATIMSDLKAKGYDEIKNAQVNEALQILLSLPEEEIKSMVTDSETPMSLRIIAKALMSTKGYEVIESILDRAHGRATQKTDISGTLKNINSIPLTPEQIKEINKSLENEY